MSDSQRSILLIELSVAMAVFSSKFVPTILMLDGGVYSLDRHNFQRYAGYLLSPAEEWTESQRLRRPEVYLWSRPIAAIRSGGMWANISRSSRIPPPAQDFGLDWDAKVAALTAFKDQHGHCRVPWQPAKYRAIAMWLKDVRRQKRNGLLDRGRIRQLDALGVVWEPHNEKWEAMFADLVAHRAKHGDCNVPAYWSENPRLASWVQRQRTSRRLSTLTQDRLKRLDKIGFVWAKVGKAWESKYAALVEFQRIHGHCRVSTLSKDHASLGNWVRTQRGRRRRGQLSQEQIRSLDRLGFSWELQGKRSRASWESMYEALAVYQRVHGHCRVPRSSKDQPGLAYWVKRQRRARRGGKLSAERIRRLDELGFCWDAGGDAQWQSMYEALAAFQRAHGHCEVSSREGFHLKRWVATQRRARHARKLSAERVRRLDELVIVWNLHDEKWERMLAELVKYKNAHGNCDVPSGWPPNPKLAAWVSTQRHYIKTGTLPPHRRKRLKELGVPL